MARQAAENVRVTPRQGRAQATVEAILEAAAQLLERDGEAGFNTNAIAERAGVSIGTIYRYFPDKRAILVALAEEERRAHQARMSAILAEGAGGLALDRALVRAFLQGFQGRNRARRIAITAMLAATGDDVTERLAPVEAALRDADGRPLDPIRAYVVSRAVTGVLRAAAFEAKDFFHDRAFEDEIVRLCRGYLGFEVRP